MTGDAGIGGVGGHIRIPAAIRSLVESFGFAA